MHLNLYVECLHQVSVPDGQDRLARALRLALRYAHAAAPAEDHETTKPTPREDAAGVSQEGEIA